MKSFSLSDQAANLTVEVLDYEHAEPQTADDACWLRCEVSAQAQGFAGRVLASLRVGEFAAFLEDLKGCASGRVRSAAFESIEDWLAIRAEFSGSGRAQLRCTLAGQSGSFPSLSFRIEIERSAVEELTEAIAGVLQEFPARGVK